MSHTPVLLFLGFRTAWQRGSGEGRIRAFSGVNMALITDGAVHRM